MKTSCKALALGMNRVKVSQVKAWLLEGMGEVLKMKSNYKGARALYMNGVKVLQVKAWLLQGKGNQHINMSYQLCLKM